MKDLSDNIDVLDDFLDNIDDASYSAYEISKNLVTVKKVDEELFIEYIKKLPSDVLGNVALELPDKHLKGVIEELDADVMADAIEELDSDDATDLIQDIEEIDEDVAKEILEKVEEDYQEEIKKLNKYDEDEAGAYMQTELFHADINESIEHSLRILREQKEKGEIDSIYQVYITGTLGRLLFTIALEDLILLDFQQTYKEALNENYESFKPNIIRDTDHIDDVAHIFEEVDAVVLPVVDEHGVLLGRITSDDIYDIIEDNATEQIYNLAGVDDEEELEDTVLESGSKRGIWLFVNLLTAILASLTIGLFEETLKEYVALAILMPIVASMGGNAGTQTLTVMVRQMALGKIDFENSKDALIKEVLIALLNGAVFALIMGVVAYFWFSEAMLGVVIAVSMVINLLMAGFFGAIIPLLLKRFALDPAAGSSVILTTVTDIAGFFSFLALAQYMLVGHA
jgi:magnesium transporter